MNASLLGALIVGIIIGMIPALFGAFKGKLGLGIIGFFACVISGVILGLLLAVPVGCIFIWLIAKNN